MTWSIQIKDPSGHRRQVFIKDNDDVQIGRDPACAIFLRDPTVAPFAARLVAYDNPPKLWLKTSGLTPPARLADIEVRSSEIPLETPFTLGETSLLVLRGEPSDPLPPIPPDVPTWHTHTHQGAHTLWLAERAAKTSLSIYLAGETGTGKEVLAHLIHAWSDRASGPFVPLHCAALQLSLADSELFGHVKGSFTGAHRQRPGALLQAHGGTLFLDEIADLSPEVQVKLLRFLENGEIRPVGADQPLHADVRLICATHHNLSELVELGRFRRDLYYRIASITIPITPLRQRPKDIDLLAKRFAKEFGKVFSSQGLLRLKRHPWLGNVRELRHAVERAAALSPTSNKIISEDCLQFLDPSPEWEFGSPTDPCGRSILSLKEMERRMLMQALKLTLGNRAQAAQLLGIARSTLFEKMRRHGVAIRRTETALLAS